MSLDVRDKRVSQRGVVKVKGRLGEILFNRNELAQIEEWKEWTLTS